MAAMERKAGLAFERHGAGRPVVFLHGLTFERRSWQSVVERLGDGLESVLVDLPGHGDTPGPPPPTLDALADRVHELVQALALEPPLVVGHSMSGALALIYAARFPAFGVVTVDQGVHVQPFAALVQSLERALRGDAFAEAFQPFEQSIGIAVLPDAIRTPIAARRRVQRELVLGYWRELLETEPAQLQVRIDETLARVEVPVLALFGNPVTAEDRTRLARLPDAHVEEWPGAGHMLHLVDPDRFARRLRAFVERCAPTAVGPGAAHTT
jgi:pimeloyl-ACP methyl ester carboxylesterase